MMFKPNYNRQKAENLFKFVEVSYLFTGKLPFN